MELTPEQLNMIMLLGVCLFLAVMILFCAGYYFFSAKETPVRDRLMHLMKPDSLDGKKSTLMGGAKETLMEVAGPIAQNLYGNNVGFRHQIKKGLREVGLNDSDHQVNKTLAACVAIAMVLGPFMFVGIFLATQNLVYAMGGVILGMLVGLKLPLINLNSRARKRKAEITFTLSDSLDLMVVCMEAGLGLDSTLQRVAEETETLAPDLSFEFRKLNKEVNAGITRIDAYHNLGTRAGVEELKALCALIIQADKLGTSVADTLRIYAEDLRTKRKQKAELLASQASIKMTFPLVFFVFPPLFIILLGPAVIQVINTFTHK